MANLWKNDKNFKIIQMSWREYVATTESWGLCDCCGGSDFEYGGYYIPLIDSWFCKTCFDAWYSTAKRYKVDIQKEQEKFIKMKHKLEDLGAWNE